MLNNKHEEEAGRYQQLAELHKKCGELEKEVLELRMFRNQVRNAVLPYEGHPLNAISSMVGYFKKNKIAPYDKE